MTKAEFLKAIEDMPDDVTIRFSYDYGDHCHHMMATEVKYVDLLPVKFSSYVSDDVIDENEEGEFLDDDKYSIVLS